MFDARTCAMSAGWMWRWTAKRCTGRNPAAVAPCRATSPPSANFHTPVESFLSAPPAPHRLAGQVAELVKPGYNSACLSCASMVLRCRNGDVQPVRRALREAHRPRYDMMCRHATTFVEMNNETRHLISGGTLHAGSAYGLAPPTSQVRRHTPAAQRQASSTYGSAGRTSASVPTASSPTFRA